MFRLSLLLAAATACFNTAPTALAGFINLEPTALGSSLDLHADGSFESESPGTLLTGKFSFPPGFVIRFAIEFDLSTFPSSATLNSAILHLTSSIGVTATPHALAGYVGNGIYDIDDVTLGSDIGTFAAAHLGGADIDVTAFVAAMLAASDTYAGFAVRQHPEVLYFFPGIEYAWPATAGSQTLTLDFTPAGPVPIPEPSTLVLSLSGCAGLQLFRRKRASAAQPAA